jgi:hypothetical protein
MKERTNKPPRTTFVLGKASSNPAIPYLGSKFARRQSMAVEISENPK